MRRIRFKDTRPEKAVRSLLHRLGFRFRLHPSKLPGKPDIVLAKYNTVVFVHGCFWHRHPGCAQATTPASRQDYWIPKFQRNVERDERNRRSIRQLGWDVITVWECELKKPEVLAERLRSLIRKDPVRYPKMEAQLMQVAEEAGKYKVGKRKASKRGAKGKSQ